MPRKVALIAEESNESVPESPLRRSTRSRVVKSLSLAPVGRTRRSSTSSVGSDVSVASVASLPAPGNGNVRTRRPSLSQESTLEKVGDTEPPNEVTPVKRTRRGSISNLQDDASGSSIRVGSPMVCTVSDRRRSLRSASKSPTSFIIDSDYVVSNGTPSKVRGRRPSADKTAPNQRAPVALEPLNEENEPVTPNKTLAKEISQSISEEAAIKNEEKIQQSADQIKSVQSAETFDKANKNRLSTKESDETKSEVSSEQTNTKLDQNQSEDLIKQPLTKKIRDQFKNQAQVVLSPLSNKISADKLSKMSELISDNTTLDKEHDKTNPASSNTDIIPLNKTADDSKSSPKRINITPQAPKRRSLRLISETISNAPIEQETPSNLITASLNSSKDSISTEESAKELKESELEPPGLLEVDGSFNLSLKSAILSSLDDELNKSSDINKIGDKSGNTHDTLNRSKENTNKRVSNVFKSNNVEQSFFEAMDVEYPSDNDESFSVANKKRASMSNTHAANITSEDSSSGSLHLICSDDSHCEDKKTDLTEDSKLLTGQRQSIALIQFDPPINSPVKNNIANESLLVSSILDSRNSILPCKVLTANQAAEENDDFDKSLQLDASSIVCKSVDGFEMTDDESGAILTIHTEMEDGTANTQLIHTKKIDESCPKQTECKEDGLKSLGDTNDEKTRIEDIILDSPEKCNIKNKPSSELDDSVSSNDEKKRIEDTILDSPEKLNIKNKPSSELDDSDSSNNEPQQEQSDSVKTRSKNDNKELQYFADNKSSDSSNTSDSESQLDELIRNKTAEFNEDSDESDSQYDPEKLLDDEAEEVSDEDTPSEDSNEIVEIGENIESTDSELEDEEYSSGSDADFIDDGDVGVLLSGNEDADDLDYDGKEVVRKKRRISSRPIDEMEDVNIPVGKDEDEPVEETQIDLIKASNKRKSKRKSSVSVQENIKISEMDNTAITGKIGNIVDVFCSSFTENKGGNVIVNVSLEYHEASSNDEQMVEKKPSPETTPVTTNDDLNKSLKRKRSEKSAATTSEQSKSSDSTKLSQIKVLQDVRISGADIEISPNQIDQPKKSTNKKKRNRASNDLCLLDDDVFQPDSSSNSKSVEMLATPTPSNIGTLPDNVISELVREEESTLKTEERSKKSKKRRKLAMHDDELEMFYKPGKLHAGTDDKWNVTELTADIKPSKCNTRDLVAEGVIDKKDFKNIMIAKNKLKPRHAKKSFMSSLKVRKQF